MTVSSMGMFASGLLSFLACRVFNLVEANTQVGCSLGGMAGRWLNLSCAAQCGVMMACVHRTQALASKESENKRRMAADLPGASSSR
jgi:hypothetical protein